MCPEQSQLGQAGTGLVSASLSTTWPLSEEAPAHPPGDPGLGGAGLPRRPLHPWGAQRCSRGLATAQTQAVGSPASKERKSGPPVGGGSMPELQGHLGLSSSTPRLIYGGHNGALDGEARPSGAGRKGAVASTSAGRWVRGLT